MSVTKLYILQEIKRTTRANGGIPLRKRQFESQTGIKRHDWFGIYWARWSDAIREAFYMQDQVQELVKPSKSLRYDRTRTPSLIRLA